MADDTGVLFLCTGNSARSILAECLLRRLGEGRFRAYSAGSRPVGQVNPFAIELLQRHGFDTTDLRSKSWDEFAQPHSPDLDFVLTVCGSADQEVCPVWTGAPMRAHWGISDPAAVQGSDADKRAAFAKAYALLMTRIEALIELPVLTMERAVLQRALEDIGR